MNATHHDETAAPAVNRWRYVVWLLLGLFVVAHGCHSDEDTELSIPAYRDRDDAAGRSLKSTQASGLGW